MDPALTTPGRDRLRVLLVAPPMLPVPPPTYAGTERVVAAIGDELHRRGHEVALVAAGDSEVPYELIPTVDHSLWRSGYRGDVASYMQHTVEIAWREATPVRHRPRAHGEPRPRLRRALRDAGRVHDARPPRRRRDARAPPGPPRRPAGRDQREPAALVPRPELGGDDPPRPAARDDAVVDRARRLPRVRRPGHAREGHPRGDRAQPPDRGPAAGRREGPRGAGAGPLRRGRPAGDRRERDRVPGRGRAAGARPALCRRARDRDARRVAGAVRAGRDRVHGDRDAGHRAPRRRVHGDDRARRDRASSSTT